VVHGRSESRGSVYRKLQHYYLNAWKDSVLIIDSDVTLTYLEQQKEVERAQKDAKRTQDILDYISDGVCVLLMPDPEHLFIEYANKQMPLLLGFQDGAQSPAELADPAGSDAAYFADTFSGVHPEDLPAVREAYRKGFALERFSIPRFRLITATGAYIWGTGGGGGPGGGAGWRSGAPEPQARMSGKSRSTPNLAPVSAWLSSRMKVE